MRRTRRRLRIAAAIAAAALAACLAAAPPAAGAEKDDLKKGLKEAGEAFKRLGKKVGEGGKEAGKEIAEAAKKVWYKGKRVSQPLLKDVQRATREFWEKAVATKDRAIEDLRDDNARMRRELEADE